MKTFWFGVAVLLLAAGLIWFGHDYLQARADIHNPESPVGKKIDENSPLQYVAEYQTARRKLNALEMVNIRTAIAMYQFKYGKNPETLEDLITARCIGEGALQDTFRQDYRLREIDGRWFLMSSGNDEILNTDDDVILPLEGTMTESPPPKTTEPATMKSTGRSLDWYPLPEEKNQEPASEGAAIQ